MDIEKIKRALEASEYEFTCLMPRLTPQFRKNAEACRELCREALKELKSQGSGQ